jgi:Heparinase II/III-like protein/Heparinase II/III N-terminus
LAVSVTAGFRLGWGALSALGPGWLGYRALRASQLQLGVLERRTPPLAWQDVDTGAATPRLGWFDTRASGATAREVEDLTHEAEAILAGRYRLFGGRERALGEEPEWHKNPITLEYAPSSVHWSRIGDFEYGDIKALWELGRFGFAFVLARAYAHSGEPRFAEGFWRLFESFCARNTLNLGVHWRCGQEAGLRLVACTFAVSVLRDAAATTPARLTLFARFVEGTARRIEANLAYALSQQNNHGPSECVGLLTAALLLPQHSASAARRKRALSELGKQLSQLLYRDGGFAQHSWIYQRLVTQLLCWAHTLLQREPSTTAPNGKPPAWLTRALERSLDFSQLLACPHTGRGPHYGPDDGSNLLLVQVAEYADLRPTLAAGAASLGRAQPGDTPSEAARWFAFVSAGQAALGAGAARARPEPGSPAPSSPAAVSAVDVYGQVPAWVRPLAVTHGKAWHAPFAGILHWRSDALALTLRCPTHFVHRPTQLDMLQLSLQCGGEHVIVDPSTYSYNAPAPFEDALSSARVHSVPCVIGREPAERISRFLFYPWPTGMAEFDLLQERFTAGHDGYVAQGVRLVREVRACAPGEFEIVDRLYAQAATEVGVHWLLADTQWEPLRACRGDSNPSGGDAGDREQDPVLGYAAIFGGQRVSLQWSASLSPSSVTLLRASAESDRGWQAPRYLEARPARSLLLAFTVRGLLTVRTRLRSVRSGADMTLSNARV